MALFGLAGMLIYQRAFVRLLPDLGIVTMGSETLRATAAGQIVFLDAAAGNGAVILAIQASNGEVLSLTNPCDCRIVKIGVQAGSTVLMGDAVVQLAAPGDAVVVVYDHIQPVGAYLNGPLWARDVETVNGRKLKGIVIKYK